MSKGKKNHKKENQNRAFRPRAVSTKSMAGATILARFQTLKKEKGGTLTSEDVIGFISMENARAIGLAGMGRENDGLLNECGEFLQAFVAEYGQNRKVMRAIGDNWGEDGPRIFRIGAYALEEAEQDDDNKLSEEQITMRDQMVEYIFAQNTCRTVTLLINNPGGGFVQQQLQFPKKISEKDMPSAIEAAKEWIEDVLVFSGSIILRFHNIGKNGKDILNGFVVAEGIIAPVPAKQMQKAQETMPDGSRKPDKTADYQTPAIIFKTN